VTQGKKLIFIFILIAIIGIFVLNTYIKVTQRKRVFATENQLMYSSEFLKWYSESYGSYPSGETWNDVIQKVRPKYTEKYLTEIAKSWDSQGVQRARGALTSQTTDAWGRSIKYETWKLKGKTHFRLGSSGKDGIWQYSSLSDYPVNLKAGWEDWNVDFDIVFSEDGGIQAQFLE